MTSTPLNVPLSPEAKDRLARVAARTGVTESALAEEAITEFLAREAENLEAIERGLEDKCAGRVVSHEAVTADVEDAIAAAERERRRE